ncbi:MAG: DUF4423 domain-containing protein [Bdellovibrionales bacterium]
MVFVFEFSSYKSYLKALEQEQKPLVRGFRSRLAEVLECQNAYISQVLNTHTNFSLEQGLKVSLYLKLNELETRYFLLLIELARAGTPELREHFQKDLDQVRAKYLNIQGHIKEAHQLSIEDQSRYYSSPYFAALHVLVTIPQFRTPEKMARALSLPLPLVEEVLRFLLSSGLITQKVGAFLPGPTQIHLSKDSPLIRQHHSHWRLHAVQSLSRNLDHGIHYATVSSLSREDAEKLKAKFVTLIQDYVETVKPSREEDLYNFNLDFYSLLSQE